MPYRFTTADARASGPLRGAAAVCADSQSFLDLLNEAQRRLLKRGRWFDTEWLAKFCIHERCITWPRWVGTVLGVRACNGNQPIMQNRWFNIVGPRSATCGWPWSCGHSFMEDVGTAPCYNEVTGDAGKLIRYYVTKNFDVGKTIRLYGTAFGNQPLQERDADGNWTDGLTITAAKPFATTTVLVTKITSVVRQATQGPARLYEYDADADKLRDLALYDPSETNPRYRRSKLLNIHEIPGCRDANNICQRQIEAMVKLAFVPAVSENDFLMIDDFDALKLAIQAIRLEEANDDGLSEAKWMKAIREMNMEIRDKEPGEQTSFNVDVVGGSLITNPI